jgi:hypothetical protein
MLLKRFPRSGFFNFGNKSKSGGLRDISSDYRDVYEIMWKYMLEPDSPQMAITYGSRTWLAG